VQVIGICEDASQIQRLVVARRASPLYRAGVCRVPGEFAGGQGESAEGGAFAA
jgi:hypothetical protein